MRCHLQSSRIPLLTQQAAFIRRQAAFIRRHSCAKAGTWYATRSLGADSRAPPKRGLPAVQAAHQISACARDSCGCCQQGAKAQKLQLKSKES